MDASAEITFHAESRTFHLSNGKLSYILHILENGQPGHLYFGKAVRDRPDFTHLQEKRQRAMAANPFPDDDTFSLEHLRQEYPSYGSSDFRQPAVEILQADGSRITEFRYESHKILAGKPPLDGLPATYTESDGEAATLELTLSDARTGIQLTLFYTVFARYAAIARSACLRNGGREAVRILTAMSLSLDLPDSDYGWLQLSGAWGRERYCKTRRLETGITEIGSLRGHSSHEHNPFAALLRPHTTESAGEVLGLSLVYSGNFRIQAETDNQNVTRLSAGIHPSGFDWKLEPGGVFRTPEAILVYSGDGLNGMSREFHRLYRERLVRGYWRDRPRPVLLNCWEAAYFDFTEDRLLRIAEKARECGVELFVLDDGWFGNRTSDRAGLGDWQPNPQRLPHGLAGLAEKIAAMGMRFGLWIEPEMVNPDSGFYRRHPDWVLGAPGRTLCESRHQLVLDFSRPEVVDAVHSMIRGILRAAEISYIKWDMNRSITGAWSAALPPDRQGEVFHRYILGVYGLYERLIREFPEILFESCSSGGARFDPGMLYYAPQTWTSDDTDCIERLKIQYGTSVCYPLSATGSHVSAVPNHQTHRTAPLSTRANVAFFGTFGYELDPCALSGAEIRQIQAQTAFMKRYRAVFQFGDFYRLKSPFSGSEAAWMCVSGDRKTAIVGWYRILCTVNPPFSRLRLQGLDPGALYTDTGTGARYFGDELMYAGLTTAAFDGRSPENGDGGDFVSALIVLTAE